MRNVISLVAVVMAAGMLVSPSFAFTTPPQERDDWATPPIHVRPDVKSTAAYSGNGYVPSQISAAYSITGLGDGTGKTIAIVEAYGSPTIRNDVNVFSNDPAMNGLQTMDSTNLIIATPQGKPQTNGGWAFETSLDVEWAHALAPKATILLVEAKSASSSNLLGAIDYANNHSASIVSMSWGASEFSNEVSYDSHFISGVTYIASSGDSGPGVEWPAVSPKVIGVGGTTLTPSNGGYSETAWPSSGGGQSKYVPEPGYQDSVQSSGKRQVPDVAFDADPNTGVAIYDSTKVYGQQGWFEVGGTSVGAPCWAGMLALSSLSSASTAANVQLYTLAPADYHDITTGDTRAKEGYDMVTGLGTPIAAPLVTALQ